MRWAEKEQSANNFLGDLIVCNDFAIVAHLGCSCSDRKRVNKYNPTWVLYLARPPSRCRLLSSQSFPNVKVFFFNAGWRWLCGTAKCFSSSSPLTVAASKGSTARQDAARRENNTECDAFRLTIKLSENNCALPARNKDWARGSVDINTLHLLAAI